MRKSQIIKNGTMTAMDGTSTCPSSDRSSSPGVALDERDVSLVRWYLANPNLANPLSVQAQCAAGSPDDNLASRLASTIPAHLQFFATVVMDFGPFHVPSDEENERFEAFQRIHHRELCGNDADLVIMRLSPRMIVDFAEHKSKRRDDLSKEVNDYLDVLAKEIEGKLLDEVDEETNNLQGRKDRERRRRKAKKKRRKDKQKAANGEEVDDAAEGDAVNDITKNYFDEENTEGGCEHTSDNLSVVSCSSKESTDVEKSASNDENATSSVGVHSSENAKSPRSVEFKSKKISYLAAAAAKIPKAKSSVAVDTYPPPSSRASVHVHVDSKKSGSTSEQNEVARLQEQLEAQRRGHLEILQQVQLKAFIAETKANSALDRSRQLERQILDATYPEVDATRVETASVQVGSAGPLSPRRVGNSGESITRADLELELRAQRRENLAMMNRVQMRILLAETKAKAAEERSLQLEKLLVDAQEGGKVA